MDKGKTFADYAMPKNDTYIIKKDGRLQAFDPCKIVKAVSHSANRVRINLTLREKKKIIESVVEQINDEGLTEIKISEMHKMVEIALDETVPGVAKSYRDYRNYKTDFQEMMDEVYRHDQSIRFNGDKENANKDDSLVATKQALIRSFLGKTMYKKFFLFKDELEAISDGYIYVHDMDSRRDTMNCCLFDVAAVLKGGFWMANIWYTEPKSLDVAFDVIGDIVLSAASQQYGGFTLPEVDKILEPYAIKSFQSLTSKYTNKCHMDEESAKALALEDVEHQMKQGFQGWEMKFNTVGSSRGDYPFVTMTLGLSTSLFGKMASIAALKVREKGQGAPGKEKPVLFPKIVFLYDENLHGEGKELEDVFEAGISCSSKTMYPDWLSLTGKGYISDMYKQYGAVISPMGCRAFLSPWYKRGGMKKNDIQTEIIYNEDGSVKDIIYDYDEPVYVGRFNIGAISLHLPMIYAKAKQEGLDFYEVLDYYLEMIRRIHLRTYDYLGNMKASTNPLAYCEGGFYGGHLNPDERIEPLLDSATASFGITALNELQKLHNKKSLVEDGSFALEVMEYINKKVLEFKEADGRLYAIYGTPAENLCGLQVRQFREKYGIIEGVSDKDYVSNSFHCHVAEDITPTEKQQLEHRFWELCNGGKIQYVKYPVNYNLKAIRVLIRKAMQMGFYEGVNLDLSFCSDCGHKDVTMGDSCPSCGSKNITKINRMNGYLAYSRLSVKQTDGTLRTYSRLSDHKMAEIKDRKSM